MCLISYNTDPSTARIDIGCYKIYKRSSNGWTSLYKDYPMTDIDKLDTTELQRPGDFYIEKGFHSFAYLSDAEYVAERFSKMHKCETCIVKCIIPKGSRYYVGKYSLNISYCSELIILKKTIKKYG